MSSNQKPAFIVKHAEFHCVCYCVCQEEDEEDYAEEEEEGEYDSTSPELMTLGSYDVH